MSALQLKHQETKQFLHHPSNLPPSIKEALSQQMVDFSSISHTYSLFQSRKIEYVQLKRQYSE